MGSTDSRLTGGVLLTAALIASLASLGVAGPATASSLAAPRMGWVSTRIAHAGASRVQVRNIRLPRGCGAVSVAVDSRKGAVWVNCVVRIREATQRVSRQFPFAAEAVAVDPRLSVAWAADNDNGTLIEISEATSKVIRRIGGLSDPTSVAVDPRTRTVWVTSFPFALAFSEVTHRLLHKVRLGLNKLEVPSALAVDPRAGMVWVVISPSSDRQPTRTWVAQISQARHKVIHTYPYSKGFAITAVDPARGIAWMEVTNHAGSATIKVISESTHQIMRTFTNVPVAPPGLAIDSRTRTVLATGAYGTNQLQVLSEKSGKVIRTIPIPRPSDVAVDENTGNVYVLSYNLANPMAVQFRL